MHPWLAIVIVWALGGDPNQNEKLAVPIPFPSKAVCEEFLQSEELADAVKDFKAVRAARGTAVETRVECLEF